MKGTIIAFGSALVASLVFSEFVFVALAMFGGLDNGWLALPLIVKIFFLSPFLGLLAVSGGATMRRGTTSLLVLGLAPLLFQAAVFIFMIIPGRLA